MDPASQDSSTGFVFADHLQLDLSPTRDFYKVMLQGLIHKNNNMLGVIQGFSSLILMDDQLAPGVRENVQQMKDSAQHSADLSKIILSTAGCARVQAEPINLGAMINYIEMKSRDICAKRKVGVTFKSRPNLPMVIGDSGRLSEVILELVKNAAEAASAVEGGEVAIDVLGPGEASPVTDNRVDLFVRNSSENMSPEKIKESFLPFVSNKDASHYGIGLTTAGVLSGQMGMRLGLRCSEGTMTAWLSMPVA